MYDTVDQWYTPTENFTPEGRLRDMQGMFAEPDFQLDPQGMIDVIIETLPQDSHRFRTFSPKELGEAAVQYQADLSNTYITP